VVPLLRRRWVARGLAVGAAAAACVIVGLAVALSQSSRTRVVTLVVGANGTATLNVSGLTDAPSGKTYEAWVIRGARRRDPPACSRTARALFTSAAPCRGTPSSP
jgi:hypothetical protein